MGLLFSLHAGIVAMCLIEILYAVSRLKEGLTANCRGHIIVPEATDHED